MQTFMPLATFHESLLCLDHMRLGKQRLECWTILRSARGEISGWRNHPATRMWRGFEPALLRYALTCCAVWQYRGYQDSMSQRFEDYGALHQLDWETAKLPPWLGDADFHLSHRSNLLRKFPSFYRQYWPDEPDDLPYIWPVGVTS